ncbi:Plant non-specific lipid-transfer protein/Par allergen protein [Dioscorea alata]|uniref:Plant non-specific lipid-transfer protein/Par allergen protein n=1 Tax=Dioscorea alata TaxID=55571 RepID=A0ACB7UHX4_DIOAL|nr:Plant non-specific lipid-transfer protein/Par allergen protein [Dioscorea alata]
MKIVITMMIMMMMMVVVVVGSNGAAVSCGDVVNALIPCGSYLIGEGVDKPSGACCRSAKGLNKMVATVTMRRQLCECMEQTGPSFGVVPKRASGLPAYCKLHIEIPISLHTNCSRIK